MPSESSLTYRVTLKPVPGTPYVLESGMAAMRPDLAECLARLSRFHRRERMRRAFFALFAADCGGAILLPVAAALLGMDGFLAYCATTAAVSLALLTLGAILWMDGRAGK